jgi:hypothetical protein
VNPTGFFRPCTEDKAEAKDESAWATFINMFVSKDTVRESEEEAEEEGHMSQPKDVERPRKAILPGATLAVA